MAPWLVAFVSIITGCEPANQDPVEGRSAAPPDALSVDVVQECEAFGYPCTWAEVDTAVARRTIELATAGGELLLETGSLAEVASLLAGQDDIGEVLGDDTAIRFWLEGGRPVWVQASDGVGTGSLGAETREVVEPGTTTAPVTQESTPNAIPGTQKSDLGEPDPKKPAKKALVLSPYDWDLGEHGPTVLALKNTPEYGCDAGCAVTEVRNSFPTANGTMPDGAFEDGRIALNVGISDFRNWQEYDLIHVSTHGSMVCRDSTATIVAWKGTLGKKDIKPMERSCVTSLSTGLTYSLRDVQTAGSPGWLSSSGATRLPWPELGDGVELNLSPRSSFCIDRITEEDHPQLYEQMKCDEGLKWSVSLTDDFFKSAYQGGLDDKIVFLSACSSLKDQALGTWLAKGPADLDGRASSVVVGWTQTVEADASARVAAMFYRLLLGHSDDYVYELQGEDGGYLGKGTLSATKREDWVPDVRRAVTRTAELLPFDTKGLVVLMSSKPVALEGVGEEAPKGPGTKSESASAGTWGLAGWPEMRAREIVALTDAVGVDLQDGATIDVRGEAGDGQPDSLDLVFRVLSVLPEHEPEDYRLGLYVDGVLANFDGYLESTDVRNGVGERLFTVELGADLPSGPFDLEPWVELPEDGGISRWVYEDLRAQPPCWVRTSWSGGEIGGTEVVDGSTPPGSRPQYITGSLFGGSHFVQGAQSAITIRLQQRPGGLVPGTYTPENIWIAAETSAYGLVASWSLGDRFNPGPASVVIRSVADGTVEGRARAATYRGTFSTIPYSDDPGPEIVNVTVDFRYPLGEGGLANCPSDS